jgi:hypothetical protein
MARKLEEMHMKLRARSGKSQQSDDLVDEGVHPPHLVRFPAISGVEPSGFVDDTTYWVGAMTDCPEWPLVSDQIGLASESAAARPSPL